MRKPSNLDAMIEALVRRMLASPPKPRKAAKKAMQPAAKPKPKGCACRKLDPVVFMVKSAEDRLSSELAEPLDRPTAR